MPTKIYWIHKCENNAQLGIMSRPRGNDWLVGEIENLKNSGVAVLISLLESSEIYELELNHEKELCSLIGIHYINFPIKDRDVPDRNNNIEELVNLLAGKLNDGFNVVIHCRMGIGRSTIIAAAVLLKYNLKVSDIIQTVSKARGVNVPDTEMQLQWLKSRE